MQLLESGIIDKKWWGIVVYEIVGNGCLIGSWAINNKINFEDDSRRFRNEIARKKSELPELKLNYEVVGEYTVSYIEPDGSAFSGTLSITENTNNGTYKLYWNIKDGDEHIGVGMKTGEKQLTVIYWAAK